MGSDARFRLACRPIHRIELTTQDSLEIDLSRSEYEYEWLEDFRKLRMRGHILEFASSLRSDQRLQ
jgi:hypothetical protein